MVKRNRVQVDPSRGDRQSFIKAAAALRVASFESLLRDGSTVADIEREHGYSQEDYQEDLDISGATSNITKHLKGEHDQKKHGRDKASADDAPSGGSLWVPGKPGWEGGRPLTPRDNDFFWTPESDIDDSGDLLQSIANAVDQLRWWTKSDGGFRGPVDDDMSRERGYLLNPDGDVEGSFIGTTNLVPSMPPGKRRAEGHVFVHNHPSDSSLSNGDIVVAHRTGLNGIYAVTKSNLFGLGLTDGLKEMDDLKLKKTLRESQDKAIRNLKSGGYWEDGLLRERMKLGSHMTQLFTSRRIGDDYDYTWDNDDDVFVLDVLGNRE